jgi:hypothetical protein
MSSDDSPQADQAEPTFVGNRFSGQYSINIEGSFPDKIVLYGVQESDLESLLHYDSPLWFALLMTVLGAVIGHMPPTILSVAKWQNAGPTTVDAINVAAMAALVAVSVVLFFVVKSNWHQRQSIVTRIRSRRSVKAADIGF